MIGRAARDPGSRPAPAPFLGARRLPSASVTLGDLGRRALVLPGNTPVTEVDDLFRADRSIRAVAIEDGDGAALLTREQLEYKMAGRLGFGRALNARSVASELLPVSRLAVSPDLDLSSAAAVILERPEESRYQDLLVLAPDGPLIVPVTEVFAGLSEDFRHASLHDPLTGLPNRRMLEENAPVLEKHVERSRTGVLFIDLDDFKKVNDTYGHRAGDVVLCEFAARLSECVRPTDTLVRLGGDEFAVLLVDVNEATVSAVAERILKSMHGRFNCIDDLPLTATIGIAMLSDITSEDGVTPLDALLRRADSAMLQAKISGKGRVGRIDGGHGPAPLDRNVHIRRRLPHALDEDAFSVHYQPQMDMPTGIRKSVEALLRWEDRELGLVSPGEFIPVAENTGEIHRIGRWVIDRACAQGRAWLEAGTPKRIAVNVSPHQLVTNTLAGDILGSLSRHGLPPELLEVELTEGAVVADVPDAAAQLQGLIDAGIGVALDDFGTANSSLALLRRLPLTAVKIDKSVIDDIDTDPFSAAVVGALIGALSTFGLKITAEGVESEGQLLVLRQLACHTVQGYLIGRAVPASEVPHFPLD